ncbi:hypothetical protein MRB53_003178 [Persea americana]|uniref:Uncharacterized protein n=1 Tax=Persea americana TaxID=3435 RepID=A0ACC2MWN9_PERAE|nr:hypothetical protein MRB53_003178 [Persea americana]
MGGGTAGCPLAATLSQNFRVLLLERSGSPHGNQNITNLATFTNTITDIVGTMFCLRGWGRQHSSSCAWRGDLLEWWVLHARQPGRRVEVRLGFGFGE